VKSNLGVEAGEDPCVTPEQSKRMGTMYVYIYIYIYTDIRRERDDRERERERERESVCVCVKSNRGIEAGEDPCVTPEKRKRMGTVYV